MNTQVVEKRSPHVNGSLTTERAFQIGPVSSVSFCSGFLLGALLVEYRECICGQQQDVALAC